MKVTGIKVEQFKILEAVDVHLSDGATVITGKNGSGKSSVLEAIWSCLGGSRAVTKPVRKGADKAVVELEVGDGTTSYTVRRKLLPSGEVLEITTADGTPMRSPQTVLNRLLGAIMFDPVEFVRTKPAEQAAVLRRVTGVDTSSAEAAVAALYDQRTEVNRKLKATEAVLADIAPGELVSVEAIAKRRGLLAADVAVLDGAESRMRELERAIDKTEAMRKEAGKTAERNIALIAKLERELSTARADLNLSEQAVMMTLADIKTYQAERDKIAAEPALPTRNAIQAEQAALVQAEERRQQAQRTQSKRQEVEAMRALAESLTVKIDAGREAIAASIAGAQYPIDGLAVVDGVVTYKGNPLHECSQAEQIVVASSIGIATFPNPGIRTLLIRDGSLLDSDSWRALLDLCERTDTQIVVEVVGDTSEAGVRIVEGHGGAVTILMEKGKVQQSVTQPESQPEQTAGTDGELPPW